ncbi:hypothetical protein BHM03_00020012 [Ensete ventricosum]|nr:hypothetical protein BHM03_00020012 [Ensete ventricosum]
MAGLLEHKLVQTLALFEDKPQSANDAWRKLHSDPLLLIRQREQEALARIKNNPIKMAMIKKSVEDEKKKQDKKEKKRHKDHHHSRSKHDKRSSRHYSDSEYTSDNQEEKTRERQTSVQQEGRSKRHKHSSRDLSDSEDAKEGAEEKRKSDCPTYEHYQHRSSKHNKHSLKDSSRRAGEGEEEGKNLHTILERQQHIHSKNEKPSSRGHSYSRYTHEENGTRSNFSASEQHHTDSELAMEDKNRETNRQREQPGYNRRRGVPKMSEEERAARLREMQLDAELHEEQRLKRLKRATEADAQEAMRASFTRGKNFLDAAQKSIYGAEKGGSATIEESVRRRAYYSQGSSAAHESNAFRRNSSVGFGARGRCEVSIGLGGVLVVRGLFPYFVVGYLQEKISVGRGPPNEAPPMAKLAL